MKKILLIITIFAASVICSCKKSLDLAPQDQISSSTFWTSGNDARLALNACYAYLNAGNNYLTGYYYTYDDGGSDNAFAQYPWESNATAIAAGNVNATIDQGYGSRYVYIRIYNYFLDNVDKAPMDADLKKRFKAEARALRALTYFELARTFGPVPLITKSYVDPKETAVTPTPVADVISYVISELTAAAADLPASYAGGLNYETGRITSGAAWAIMARVQLQYGQWADAVASAQKVMDMGYALFRVSTPSANDMLDDFSPFVTFADNNAKLKFYKGLASYEDQFLAANELTSKEIILSSQNITNSSYTYGNGLRTLFPPGDLGGWSSITPTQELINAYWDSNGNTFTPPTADQRAANYNNGAPTPAFFDEYKNRDTRLYASVLFESSPYSSFLAGYKFTRAGGSNNTKTGYNFRKMVDPAYQSDDWDGEQDFAIIRYAEILLTYAEAKNELSGPDPSIYAALNDIRDRAGMPPVQAGLNQDQLRQVIRNERRIELAGEGQRFWDIRRWGIAKDVMKTTYDVEKSVAQQRNWQDKFILMPYPQVALDHNANLKAAQTAKGY